jgi:hypothetical protein
MNNLSRSSDPDLSLTKILRLRGSAVSLSREAHKAQRKLDKLQAVRAIAAEPEPTALSEPTQPEPAQPQPTDQEPTPLETAQPPAASTSQPAPPTPAELAALHTARELLNSKKPIATGGYGSHFAVQQLRKRVMVQTMKENAARNAAEHARRMAEKAAAQLA